MLSFHHTYFQNYEVRQQVKGGIIGDKLAGEGARLCRILHDQQLYSLSLKVRLLFKVQEI